MNRTHSMPRRTLMAALLVTIAVGVTGCGAEAEPESGAGRLRIVATTGMVADIVRQVAGSHAEVEGLMGEGIDPHLYRPTRRDVLLLTDADVVFYSGLKLEGRMGDTFGRIGASGKPVCAVTERLDRGNLIEPEGADGHWDPHVWMDVSAWIGAVRVVASQLQEVDAPHAEDYRRSAAAYVARLERLHEYARTAVATIPASGRVLLTAHDAFNYFGRAYGIEVRGIQGLSTESAASVKSINTLVDLVVEHRIRAIFVESSVNPDSVKALQEGARARGHDVAIGGELYSDAMGTPGTYAGTYEGMMDHNVTTIVRALGGSVPEGGFREWLRDRE